MASCRSSLADAEISGHPRDRLKPRRHARNRTIFRISLPNQPISAIDGTAPNYASLVGNYLANDWEFGRSLHGGIWHTRDPSSSGHSAAASIGTVLICPAVS